MLLEHSVLCPVLLGRTGALRAGVDVLQRAAQGSGTTVLVSGEAGIGKSRLLRALADEARGAGFLVLQGVSFGADRGLPFAPLLDLVRSFATHTSPAVAAHAFAPAAAELLAFFPELGGVLQGSAPAPATDPEHGRRRLFQALLLAFHRLSRRQPLLMVFEDVHWSDDATLDLLFHLARGTASHPVLLALSYRDAEVGPHLGKVLREIARMRLAAELPLRPLTPEDTASMVGAIFGVNAPREPGFVALLHNLTEGNPFFVEEVLKSLVVAGDLAAGADGRWRVRRLERLHVPRSALDAVRHRLAGLSAAAREVASLAAVSGRRFDFALLHAVSGHDEAMLLELVKELATAQLVVEESADTFAFRHALTREAIYAELLTRERVAMHSSIAAALERLYPDPPESVVETLASHTHAAGEWVRAQAYATRAAEHAVALNAPREALAYFDRAIAATRNAGCEPELTLRLSRGQALETLGEFEAAHAEFSAVATAARAIERATTEWQALHALGMLWAARDYARAGTYREQALEIARRLGDPALVARSLNRIGNWHLNLEQPGPARRYHAEALPLLQQIGDLHGVAETLDLLAMACHIAGDQHDAVNFYQQAMRLFTELGSRRGIAPAQAVTVLCGPSHHSSATRFAWSGLIPDVLATETPVRLTREIGWRAGEAFCRMLLADCLAWRGEWARAVSLAGEALTIAEELDHLEWQAGASRVLGVIALDLCQHDVARERLEHAHAIARRLGSHTWTRWTAAPLALARARQGEHGGALAVLDAAAAPATLGRDALRPSDESSRTLGERHLQLARAEVHLLAGDPHRTLALVDESITWEQAASEGEPRTPLPRHGLLRGLALLALSDAAGAGEQLRIAAEDAAATAALPLSWRAHAALGQLHRMLRRRREARAAFDRAREIAAGLEAGVPDEALASAFRRAVDAMAPAPAPPTVRQAAKAAYGGLTRRERQVAQLVSGGLSNRAIADSLGIGERTVEDHVARAFAKLGFSSRAQLAAWAVQQGLEVAPQ